MKHIAVVHGPNLNLLGRREKKIYGNFTLTDLNARLLKLGRQLTLSVISFQSNSEGEIIDLIQNLQTGVLPPKIARKKSAPTKKTVFDGLIINPAAYTHTSVAIRDALATLTIPVIEVHLSNIAAREEFRRVSFVSSVVTGSITGFGMNSYLMALQAMGELLQQPKNKRK